MVGVGIATLSEMMMMVEDKNVNFAQTRVDICLAWSFSTTTQPLPLMPRHHLTLDLLTSDSSTDSFTIDSDPTTTIDPTSSDQPNEF